MSIEEKPRVARRLAPTMSTHAIRAPIDGHGPPRLYALHPGFMGSRSAWSAHLERVAALGFDAVLLPIGFDVAPLLPLASRAGVAVHVDIDLSRTNAGSPLHAAVPEAFSGRGADGLDPRESPREHGFVRARWEGAAVDGLLEWWGRHLRGLADAGVAGFRCLEPAVVPAPVWRRITAGLAACRFLAWTPGSPLRPAGTWREPGFAGVFDSLAWWDCRAGWFADELAALARIAPVLATLEAPGGTRFAAGFERAEAAVAASRQLRIAAFASGLLVPMGFEFCARSPVLVTDTAADWDRLVDDPPADLQDELRAVNAAIAERGEASSPVVLTGADAPVFGLYRGGSGDILLVNRSLDAATAIAPAAALPATGGDWADFRSLLPPDGAAIHLDCPVALGPGEARLFRGSLAAPVLAPAPAVAAAAAAPRVAIEAVAPAVDSGRFAVKRVAGEVVEVSADLICDGHDRLAGVLCWRSADAPEWRETPLLPLGNDRWGAAFPLERVGRFHFRVEAWVDVFATFRHGLEVKADAGLDVALEVEEGRRLVAAASAELGATIDATAPAERLAALRAPATAALMALSDPRPHRATSAELTVDADRAAARFASWYELFPRSQSGDPTRHGTFADVIAQLPRIAAMGFDVVYFPPIHPIGRGFRKGRNNSLTPAPDDPGSPYAIGGEAGGHDAIHPELGTLDDFRQLRDAAAAHGLELALDFAVQCSPDHPWLRDHPEWFAWRPDGSLRYAENPPKKYQDIVNVDFHAPDAIPALWLALRDVVRFWADEGVRLFRVDNPHTKPLPFWEWLIADIRATDPGVVFLAEAFTRPKVMYRLAKLGFGQSYTYFTWRNEKQEIMDYLTELTTTAPRDYFRPHFFVNTPDINPVFLQGGGRPAHLIRAALACTLSGLWGMYQGFEHCEATPLPGREEYLDSEKYQMRVWPDRSPGDIVDEITRLNAIRRSNPALQDHLGVAFHPAKNDRVLWFRKRSADGTNVLLIAISLDPYAAQEAAIELPLWEWTLPDDAALEAEELMRGERVTWRGKTQRVRLEPALPFAIWRVRPEGAHRPHLPPVAPAPAPTGHG